MLWGPFFQGSFISTPTWHGMASGSLCRPPGKRQVWVEPSPQWGSWRLLLWKKSGGRPEKTAWEEKEEEEERLSPWCWTTIPEIIGCWASTWSSALSCALWRTQRTLRNPVIAIKGPLIKLETIKHPHKDTQEQSWMVHIMMGLRKLHRRGVLAVLIKGSLRQAPF